MQSVLCRGAKIHHSHFYKIMGMTFYEYLEHLDSLDIAPQRIIAGGRKRVNGSLQGERIIGIATGLAAQLGYVNVTRAAVARACDMSPASVSRYLGTREEMRHSMVAYAIDNKIVDVVNQAVEHEHELVIENK